MTFILLLGLTLLDGSVVYQKYTGLDSQYECHETASVVARQYFDEGVLERVQVVCYGGDEV